MGEADGRKVEAANRQDNRGDSAEAPQRLRDALIAVECSSGLLAEDIRQVAAVYRDSGPPRSRDWLSERSARVESASRILEAERASLRALGKVDEAEALTMSGDTWWSRALEDFVEAYREWNISIAAALDACIPAAAPSPLTTDWVVGVRTDLRYLAGVLHPSAVGADGLGVVRGGQPTIPDSFFTALEKISHARLTLIDLLSADSSLWNAKPTPIVGLTDSHLAVLDFMKRAPTRCWQVTEITVRDRKHVRALLIELNEMGLVWYPSRGQTGAVLRPAAIAVIETARLPRSAPH